MQIEVKTYRQLALVLWGVVCGVAGISMGYYFAWGQRKTIFAAVVLVGMYLLLLLRKKAYGQLEIDSGGSVVDPGKMGTNGIRSDGGMGKKREGPDRVGGGSKREPGGGQGKDSARQWLDEFLVKQQEKKD